MNVCNAEHKMRYGRGVSYFSDIKVSANGIDTHFSVQVAGLYLETVISELPNIETKANYN